MELCMELWVESPCEANWGSGQPPKVQLHGGDTEVQEQLPAQSPPCVQLDKDILPGAPTFNPRTLLVPGQASSSFFNPLDVMWKYGRKYFPSWLGTTSVWLKKWLCWGFSSWFLLTITTFPSLQEQTRTHLEYVSYCFKERSRLSMPCQGSRFT